MYTKQQLKGQLAAMGIRPDDTVLIHTSFRTVGEVENGPDGFIDAFCEHLSEGLFVVPTHTWKNVNREAPVFDVRSTVPNIGLVPRTAAFRPDGIRSLHPTHSVWAHGKDAAAFVAGEESARTPAPVGGLWYRFAQRGTKILLVGVDHSSNTFIHSVDEILEQDEKLVAEPWEVTVIGHGGERYTHPFRNHGYTGSKNFNNYDEAFTALGVQTFGRLGDATVRVVDAAKCRDAVLRIYSRTSEQPCFERRTLPREWWAE